MAENDRKPSGTPPPLVLLKSRASDKLEAFTRFLTESGYRLLVLDPDELKVGALPFEQPAAILFDGTGAQGHSLENLGRLTKNKIDHPVPVFFISDQDDETLAAAALDLGADDWIPFPVREKEALLRIKHLTDRFSHPAKDLDKQRADNEARLESLPAINEYQTESTRDLLDFALHQIIALTESKIGYIYFYDENKQEFTLNSWSKDVMDDCKVMEPQTTCRLAEAGIWGEVVRQRQPMIINDFQEPNPLKKGMPEGHVGLTRFLSIPVFDNNEIVAVVGVGNKPEAYDQTDIRQLSLLMNSVWAAVRKKKQERQLAESEERFRTTLYSIGDGVITTDAKGYVQMMNKIAERLTGWTQADAQGKLLEEVFPIINEKTRQTVEIPVRRVLREGAVVGLANHTMLIAKDGTERPIADSAAPIRNEQGEIYGVVLVFRDQTDEREAERKLQESEFFFRESQRAATIGSYKLEVSTGIWTSSEVLDRILGIDKDYNRDIDGWEELIYPDDLAMMDHHFKVEVIGQKNPFNKEYRIIRKSDGALRWVHGLGQLIPGPDGRLVSMIGIIQDITERKKAEEEIQNQNNRLNAIINAMPDLIFISDRDGTYLEFFNPKSRGMLYPADKLIGANIRDVFDPETAELHLQKIQECLDKKEPVNYEYTGGKNGETVYFDGRIVPFDENRVLRFVRDITESKKMQEEQFRLLNIIDHSLNEIYVFDSETLKFSYVNQGALKNLGYSSGEMKALTPVDIKPKFDRDTFIKSIEPLISGQKKKLVFETLHQRKDGTTYPVEVHLQLHRHGRKNVFFAVINDITSRKLSEALVRESEEMFRKLAESTPIAICIYQDEKWVYTNPAGEELTGYNLKEYQSMFIWEFVAPEHQEMIKKYARMRMEGSVSGQGYEFRIIRKNGESRWVYLKGSRINYKGRPAGLISVLDMTEKKKIEDELRQSEERFRKAITEAPFPMMLHAENGQVIALSRGWTEISGYRFQDIPTTSEWVQKAYGSKQADVKSEIEQLYSLRHYVEEGRYTITTQSGEQRIWEFGSAPLGVQHDGQRLVISMAKDMTDHIRSSELIQNERMLLRTVIDHLPDPIYVKDSQGRKLLANKADLENIGAASEAEVIGKTDFELFDQQTAQPLWEDDQKVLQEGQSIINREEIFHEGKKTQRWLLTTKVPLRDQQGRIVGLVGIGRDITQQRKARETIQKLSKGIEQNPTSIVITDLQGNMEYVNPRFSETTGYSAEEALGQNPRILKSGEMPNELYKNLWDTITRGDVWRGEFLNRKKNGALFWEQATITSIRNDDGKITHYIAIKEDISQRKQMEADLIMAKEKAEESDRLKSAFLANMSHEIRTPLNSIIGFSELLNDEKFDAGQKGEFIGYIIESGNQLLNIISDILDISKIESGEIVIRKTEIPAKKLLEEIRSLHRLKVESKLLQFRVDYPENIQTTTVVADKERLHQIFNNLISNALKFTSKGHIQVGCTQLADRLEFYVRDTGIGIDPKFHAKVFERFRQVETELTRKFGGNGLGLAITKNLVELMGGTIRLESEPGKGSTFYFTVPLAPGQTGNHTDDTRP